MALDNAEIDLEQVKWIILMVLFNRPGQEDAYARMEELVFDDVLGRDALICAAKRVKCRIRRGDKPRRRSDF